MFARVGLPMVFVFLWSSAFVTGKIAVIYATPFAFLLLRFSIVALLFGGLMLAAKAWLAHQRRKPQTPAQDTPAQDTPDNWRTLLATAIVGVVLHGQLAIGRFQFLFIGSARHAENIIEITLAHACCRKSDCLSEKGRPRPPRKGVWRLLPLVVACAIDLFEIGIDHGFII